MLIMKKPEAFTILTLSTDCLDWEDRFIYAEQLRRYGYQVEALELEDKLDEGQFYEFLEMFLNNFKPEYLQ